MKKILLFVLLAVSFITISGTLKAQSLYFCESVDKDGYPVGQASTFTIPSAGGYLNMLVRLPYALDAYSVRYEIYKTDGYNETYDNTINQDAEKNWVWFWKQVTFYKTGTYNIYVYDDTNNLLLTSGTVQIKY